MRSRVDYGPQAPPRLSPVCASLPPGKANYEFHVLLRHLILTPYRNGIAARARRREQFFDNQSNAQRNNQSFRNR